MKILIFLSFMGFSLVKTLPRGVDPMLEQQWNTNASTGTQMAPVAPVAAKKGSRNTGTRGYSTKAGNNNIMQQNNIIVEQSNNIMQQNNIMHNQEQDQKTIQLRQHKSIDFKNISKYMGNNSSFIDLELLNQINLDFLKYIQFFRLTKGLLSKKDRKNGYKELFILLNQLGVSDKDINLIVQTELETYDNTKLISSKGELLSSKGDLAFDSRFSIADSKNMEQVENLYYKIEEYAAKRNINVNNDDLDILLRLVKGILDMENPEMNSIVLTRVISNIENECNYWATHNITKSSGSRKHPNREVPLTKAAYEKGFNNVIKLHTKELHNELIRWITGGRNDKYVQVKSMTVIVQEILADLNFKIAQTLLGRSTPSRTHKPAGLTNNIVISKESTKARVKKIYNENIQQFISNTGRDIQESLDIITLIESMESLDNKVEKLASFNTPLLKTIKNILDSNLSTYDKQASIEKGILEYELNFFNKNIDNVEARNKILHKVYPNFKKAYSNLIDEYKLNNYFKLKKSVKEMQTKILEGVDLSLHSKEFYKTFVILIIMYLGIEKCISYSFSQIIQLLNNNTDEHRRTNIAINLAHKIIRLFKIIDFDVEHSELEKILPVSEFKNYLFGVGDNVRHTDDTALFWLGDTLLHLITDNCDIIVETLLRANVKESYLILRLNDKFVSDLTIGNISLLQLPMLTEPRKIVEENLGAAAETSPTDAGRQVKVNTPHYFPYINTDSSILNLFDAGLIKFKYNQRDKTKGSETLYRAVDYLNSMKFRINKVMLNFVLTEWVNKESKIFNGLNIYQPLLETDSKLIKEHKISHNSKFHLYSNIINIACLYKDHNFYFPVFADFRGRIYPLSNYLNYQGGDLAKSLLLFGIGDELNDSGIECLNIYLANLAGYDKLSWNDRLTKVDSIIAEYLDSVKTSPVNYIEKNKDRISDPFQFMSIMFAKLLHLKNPSDKVSNPILFDASCSGIQHIASLTLEKELASNVNVISESLQPKDDLPEDFYTYALSKITETLKNCDVPELREIKLTRKMIKRSVMTIPYNISMVGISEQLMEHFEEMWVLKERFVCKKYLVMPLNI